MGTTSNCTVKPGTKGPDQLRWNLTPLVSGIGRTPGTPPEGGRFAAELVLLRIITGELNLASHDGRMFALSLRVIRRGPGLAPSANHPSTLA